MDSRFLEFLSGNLQGAAVLTLRMFCGKMDIISLE